MRGILGDDGLMRGKSEGRSLRGEMLQIPGIDAFLLGLTISGLLGEEGEDVSGCSWRVLQGRGVLKASGILDCVDGRG